MTKKEITAMIKAVPAEAIHEFLRNALKAGILTEDDISEHYGRPFSWLGLAEIHRDTFRVQPYAFVEDSGFSLSLVYVNSPNILLLSVDFNKGRKICTTRLKSRICRKLHLSGKGVSLSREYKKRLTISFNLLQKSHD